MNAPREGKSPYFMKSLATGLKVLEVMAEAGRPLVLTEIARTTGLNNATTTRVCQTLSSLGFVRRDAKRRYHLTPKVLLLGYAAVSRLGWLGAAQHYMEALFEEVRETVNLSVLEGREILYIRRLNTGNILPYDLQIGSKLPLHCTSMGKALIAFQPEERAREILESLEFRPMTHQTITSLEEYLTELETVRRKGYAINNEELSVGLRSVAAPILDREGRSMAAVNIAVPTKRYSRGELEDQLAPKVVGAAQDISEAVLAMSPD